MMEAICGARSEGVAGYPAIIPSRYLRAEFQSEIDRLADEVDEQNPNCIVCLGAIALWAFTGHTTITKLRGATQLSTHCISGYKILPTYHPSFVIRNWTQRPVTVIDLMKAKRQAEFPDLRRPSRKIWIEPNLQDMELFYETHIRKCEILSVDIETRGTRITCIGFAPSSRVGIVIPFDDSRRKDGNYWATHDDERRAWRFVRQVLEDPGIPKLFQ